MTAPTAEQDFFERFTRLLANIKDRLGFDTLHDALIVWFAENSCFLDPEDVKDRIVHDSHAEGVDSILVEQTYFTLQFVQAQVPATFENSKSNFPENKLKLTLDGVRFLLTGDYKGKITPELENLVDEYHELEKTGDYKTKIVFLSPKKPPLEDKFITNFRKDFPSVEVEFWGFEKLADLYRNNYLLRRAPAPERITLEVISKLESKDIPIKARVFTTKGKELARAYDNFKERIFQQNVRYFLGLRSKSINREILNTATSDDRSQNFWYFNNGVTIVCKKISESVSGKVVHLEGAQIINGAQTTYALYEAFKTDNLKDNVEVLVKAIETDDRKLIENITQYTNSQNAIKLRDLSSNDEVQQKLHNILLGTYRYFYETKRGEFESLHPTPDAKKKLLGSDYKTRIISNENAAQALLAMFLDKPAQAKSEKGRIFLKDGGFYTDIFSGKDDALEEKILVAWKLLNYIQDRKNEYRKEYRRAADLVDEKKNEVYKYDFLLHAEYFILNLMRDFLKNYGFDLETKNGLLKIVSLIDTNDGRINEIYETIRQNLAEYIGSLRVQPGYYHNKFFKNEKSIGLIRNSLKSRYKFMDVFG